MAINIPDSPNTGDTYTVGSRTWRFNGTTWDAVLYSAPTGPTGAAGADGATGPTGPSGSDGALSPNYIINGAFDIWQRGTSFTPITSKVFQADRWACQYGGGTPTTVSLTQGAFTPAELTSIGYGEGQFYLRNTITDKGAATQLRMQTYIEDARTVAGQVVTVSFWAKNSSTSGNIRPYLFQNFGSGGSSATFTAPSQGAQSLTASWQRFTFNLTVPSITGKTFGAGNNLELRIQAESFSNGDVIDIWGVQLEAGSVATPFRRNANSIQGELAACQRYYQRIQALSGNFATLGYGFARSTTAARAMVPMLVEMRAAPTLKPIVGNYLLADGVTNSNVSAISISGYSPSKHAITVEATATGLTTYRPYALIADNGTHYLEFEAEL